MAGLERGNREEAGKIADSGRRTLLRERDLALISLCYDKRRKRAREGQAQQKASVRAESNISVNKYQERSLTRKKKDCRRGSKIWRWRIIYKYFGRCALGAGEIFGCKSKRREEKHAAFNENTAGRSLVKISFNLHWRKKKDS